MLSAEYCATSVICLLFIFIDYYRLVWPWLKPSPRSSYLSFAFFKSLCLPYSYNGNKIFSIFPQNRWRFLYLEENRFSKASNKPNYLLINEAFCGIHSSPTSYFIVLQHFLNAEYSTASYGE